VFKGEAPTDLPIQAVLSIDDMAGLEAGLTRAYKANGAFKPELSIEDFEAIRKALAPEFRIYEPLSVSLSANEATLARLTRQQLQVLRGFETNPRAIIEGVAGSGKTLLAMQRARSFASAGHRVLFTCFNSELAKWIREEFADELVENGGRIRVENFHRLAADLCREAGIEFNANAAEQQKWWDERAPDLLAQAAMDLYSDEAPFTALVVDEAQDFSPGWWDALEYLLKENGPVWAFLDTAQSLRREPVDPPIKSSFRFALDINCRNTRRIVACATAATNIASLPFETAPLGRPPKIITPPNAASISGLVQGELRSLLKEHRITARQIAILGPTAKGKGPLANVRDVDGVSLVEDAGVWREGGGILVTTARSFKGLEADVVLLADFSGLGGLFTVCDLYVALTRARSHLIIVAHDRPSREQLDAAIAAAVALGNDE
jgi:DNA helicase IV